MSLLERVVLPDELPGLSFDATKDKPDERDRQALQNVLSEVRGQEIDKTLESSNIFDLIRNRYLSNRNPDEKLAILGAYALAEVGTVDRDAMAIAKVLRRLREIDEEGGERRSVLEPILKSVLFD